MSLPIGSIAFLAVAGAALGVWYWKLFLHHGAGRMGPDWLLEFSADRYAILGRMLAGDDYDWILRQTGGDKQLCRDLRSSRRKAFRRYLSELSRDFTRLQLVSRMIVVDSFRDESDLARFLIRQTVFFRFQLLAVRLRLALSLLRPGNIDVGPLLQLVQGTHGRLFWLAAGASRPSAQ